MGNLEAPNRTYLEMNFVGETATGKGNNSQIIMENLNNGMFRVTDGRVGIRIGRYKPKMFTYPMTEWNRFYTSKIQRGYLLTKTNKMEKKEVTKSAMSVNGANYKPLEDNAVNDIITRLIGFANQVIETNFTVKVDDISDEMIAYGRKILDELAIGFKTMSVAEFNNKLKTLYAAIPRRIDKLSNSLAKRKLDFNDIIANEQDLYDIMIGQIRNNQGGSSAEKTILDAMGLKWRNVTKEEEDAIRTKLGCEANRYMRAWRISNERTENNFNAFCESENLEDGKGIEHLFHGSRNENFWSIITNGLTINPTGVVITGKMFGNGTYFAPDACKSMGYTSRSGSRWANGTSNSGFLAIYKVATGNPASPQCAKSYDYKTLKEDGYHSVWCKRGGQIGLRMDEVIVYQDNQSTIEYLVEIGI